MSLIVGSMATVALVLCCLCVEVTLAVTPAEQNTTAASRHAKPSNLARHAQHKGHAPPLVHSNQYNYGLPNKITHLVNLTIAIEDAPVGVIQIGLYGRTVPKTVENFNGLCSMTKGYGYKNSTIHRVLRSLLIQGGDFERGDGTGGYSIFPTMKRFEAENYQIPHMEGCVAMASESKTGLGSQFYLMTGTTESARFLNGKHVVFGQIVDGYTTVIKRIMHTPTRPNNAPIRRISIADCAVGPFVDPHENDKSKHHRLVDDEDEDDRRQEGEKAGGVPAGDDGEGPRIGDFDRSRRPAAAPPAKNGGHANNKNNHPSAHPKEAKKGEEKQQQPHGRGGAHGPKKKGQEEEGDRKEAAKERAKQRHERLKVHLQKKHDAAAGKETKKHKQA